MKHPSRSPHEPSLQNKVTAGFISPSPFANSNRMSQPQAQQSSFSTRQQLQQQHTNSHTKLAGVIPGQRQQIGAASSSSSAAISRQFHGGDRATHVSTFTVTNGGSTSNKGVDRKSSMLQQYHVNNGSNILLASEADISNNNEGAEQISAAVQMYSRTSHTKYETTENTSDVAKQRRSGRQLYGQKQQETFATQKRRQSSTNDNLQAMMQGQNSHAKKKEKGQKQNSKRKNQQLTTKNSIYTSVTRKKEEAEDIAFNTSEHQSMNKPKMSLSIQDQNGQNFQESLRQDHSSGLSMLEVHEQALIRNKQKQTQQQSFFTHSDGKKPSDSKILPENILTSKEYGITTINSTEPNLDLSTSLLHQQVQSTNYTKIFSKVQAPQLQNLHLIEPNGGQIQITEQEDISHFRLKQVQVPSKDTTINIQSGTQNLLPESIFHQNKNPSNGQDDSSQTVAQHQPAWKHARGVQRKSDIASQRQREPSNNHAVSLNTSVERKHAYATHRQSPYDTVSKSTVNNHFRGSEGGSFISQPGTTGHGEKTKPQIRSTTRQQLDTSIENERNRIQDVVNSSSFGPNSNIGVINNSQGVSQNVLFTRQDSANSPLMRTGTKNEKGPFSGAKQSTKARHNQNGSMGKHNNNARNDDNVVSTFATYPLQSSLNQQSASQTGIPQITNGGSNSTYSNPSQPQQNGVTLPRSLYQTHQGGKYNFITPMILSDLHLISSIQQTAPPNEEHTIAALNEESNMIISPTQLVSGKKKNNTMGSKILRNGGAPSSNSRRAGPTTTGNAMHDQRLAPTRSYAANIPQFEHQVNSGKAQEQNQVNAAPHRPISGLRRSGLVPASISQVSKNLVVSPDINSRKVAVHGSIIGRDDRGSAATSSQAPFTQKRRRLKTPGAYGSALTSQHRANEAADKDSNEEQKNIRDKPGKISPFLQSVTNEHQQQKPSSGLSRHLQLQQQQKLKQEQDSRQTYNRESLLNEKHIETPSSSAIAYGSSPHFATTTTAQDHQSKRVEGGDALNAENPHKRRLTQIISHKASGNVTSGKCTPTVGRNSKQSRSNQKKVANDDDSSHSPQSGSSRVASSKNSDIDDLDIDGQNHHQDGGGPLSKQLSQSSISAFDDAQKKELASANFSENSYQSEMEGDQTDWSLQSVISKNHKIFLQNRQKQQKQDEETKQESEAAPKQNNNASTAENPEQKGKQSAQNQDENDSKIDYFDKARLALFNKHQGEKDSLTADPIAFSQSKVAGFLVKNPLNLKLMQKDKGRLPYSVFKPHSNQVTFLKSIFEGRPPVAFFQYPSYVGIKRVADRIRMYTREEVEHLFMSFRISDSTHIYNAVVNSCKAAGFSMLESNNTHLFNVQWTGYITANDIKHLNKYQKTNHFPGSTQLGRKDLLWRNMSRMRSKFPRDFVISPISYLINEDHEAFLNERERDPTALWILKPVAASCGRGIKIVNSTQRVSRKEGMLACKYIANPHLLNGLKYDLRVYVLVTSFNPLRIYMYNDGLVRFATEKYSNDPRKLQKKYVHLTNFSINKKNTNFVKNTDKVTANNMKAKKDASAQGPNTNDEDQQEFETNSSKWDFKMLRAAYEKHGINYEYVIAQFKDLIVKTLLCVEPHVTQNLQKNPTNRINCFELYGFDIIVDQNYKPWVLEVNVLPSLSSSSPFDKRIKTMLICDTLTLVGIRGYDKQKFHSQHTELLGLAPFTQSMTLSELRQKQRMTGSEQLSKDELELLMDLDEEFMRRGNFQRIFPLASNASFYEQFFETKRYQNALCAAYLTSPQHIRDQLLAKYRRIYNSQV